MLVRNKKTFGVGIVLAISFLSVLFLIFTPVFDGKNGLVFSDDAFNKLAKGSSYFIPKVSKSVEKYNGKPLSASIKVESAEHHRVHRDLILLDEAADGCDFGDAFNGGQLVTQVPILYRAQFRQAPFLGVD